MKKLVASALGMTAADKLEAAHQRVEAASAAHAAQVTLIADLKAKRKAAVEDADSYVSLAQQIDIAKKELQRRVELLELAKETIPEFERAALQEELAEVTQQVTAARDRVLTAADAVGRARAAEKSQRDVYYAEAVAAEELFVRARDLAAQLGEALPPAAAVSPDSLGKVRLLCLAHDATVFFSADQRVQAEGDLLRVLLELLGQHPAYAMSQAEYSNADRIRDLRKDPEIYRSRTGEYNSAAAADLERVRSNAAREDRRAAEQDEAARRGRREGSVGFDGL